MKLMIWKMTIIHHNNDWLVDADYRLRKGKNLCLDPLLDENAKQTSNLKLKHPAPTGQVLPQNMPNFMGSRQSTPHVTNIYANNQNPDVTGKNLDVSHTCTDERIIHNPITIILF